MSLTLTQIENSIPNYIDKISRAVQHARRCATAMEEDAQEQRAKLDVPGWEGEASDKALERGVRDKSIIFRAAESAFTGADYLVRQKDAMAASRQCFFSAVERAQDNGFTVHDDLSVTYSDSSKKAQQSAAQQHAENIKHFADNIEQSGRDIAFTLPSITAGSVIAFPAAPRKMTPHEINQYGFWPSRIPLPKSPGHHGTIQEVSGEGKDGDATGPEPATDKKPEKNSG